MIETLIRPHLLKLAPYSTARDEFTGSASIYLDANENPFPSQLNRYPDPHHRQLKARVAALKGVPEANIFIGSGSDEAIDLVIRTVAAPDDSIVITPPTYGMYKVSAATNAVEVYSVPLDANFEPDGVALREYLDRHPNVARLRAIFLCSPNNPTGKQISLDRIEEVLNIFPGLVVVDEAYIDFASGPSAVALLPKHDRLVVLQTLSKAWGLAGARVGLAFGHAVLISVLNKVKLPYNVNTLSQKVALEVLTSATDVQNQIDILKRERELLAASLQELALITNVYPSEANFLLVRTDRSREIFEYLTSHGVIVRDRSREPGCQGCLRITVGTPEENREVVDLIRKFT